MQETLALSSIPIWYLNPVSFNLKTYGSRAFSVLPPPNFGTNYLTTYKPSFLRTFTLVNRKMYLILYVFYLNLNLCILINF